MRKFAFFALAIVSSGCSADPQLGSNEPATPRLTDPGVTPAQVQAFGRLQADTGMTWAWSQQATLATPMHLSAPRTGKGVLTAGARADHATVAFVGQYKDLFKMRDAATELAVTTSEVDALAMTHVRFQQVTHGVPVVGAELAAHYDGEGRMASILANYVSGIGDLNLEPSITAKAAKDIALAEVAAYSKDVDENLRHASDGNLVVFALGSRAPTLAYQVTVRAVYGNEPAVWVTTIDAKTGKVIDRYNDLQTIEATGKGVLGDVRKFEVAAGGSGYVMRDTSTGTPIMTYSAGGKAAGPDSGATLVTSPTLASWDTGLGAGAAVDAHTNSNTVAAYYLKVHGRKGIDGVGGALLSTVHYGKAYDNAFWDGTGMTYGDGGQDFIPLSASLAVAGHEISHGITQLTSKLGPNNQQGATNEAWSDIMGAYIKHSKTPSDKDWSTGEEIAKSGLPLRDAKTPGARYPAHMSQYSTTQTDQGGIHTNCTIVSHTAYLMTMGGINSVSKTAVPFGLGWDKAEKLWFRANTKYFLTTTDFAQAAQATMQAAKDLAFTENEQNIVDCAWKATGVVTGACSPMVDPKAVAVPVGGPDAGATSNGAVADNTGKSPTDAKHSIAAAEAPETTPPAAPRRSTLGAGSSSGAGCSVPSGAANGFSPWAGLFAAVFGIAAVRRRKRA